MQFDKAQVLDLLRSQGDDQQAQEADKELPDTVDTEKHGDVLGRLGLDPKELIGRLTGGSGMGGLGDLAGR